MEYLQNDLLLHSSLSPTVPTATVHVPADVQLCKSLQEEGIQFKISSPVLTMT